MFPTKQDTGGLRSRSYLLPAAPPGGKISRSNSYQRGFTGVLDHNGCGNLIINAVAAVFYHYDAHFAFAGNNRDLLTAVTS